MSKTNTIEFRRNCPQERIDARLEGLASKGFKVKKITNLKYELIKKKPKEKKSWPNTREL